MDRQEFFDRELAEYAQRWSDGDFPALAEAVEFCHLSAAPVPEWMAKALIAELHAAFHGIGPRSRGMGRGPKDRMIRQEIQRQRAAWAEFYLNGRGDGGEVMTRRQAFEAASLELRGSRAQGTAEEIEKAYNAVRRRDRLRQTVETT
jgi:hypothetical protein